MGNFIIGFIFYAFLSKVWWFLTLPGRALAVMFGMASSTFNASGLMGILVLIFMVFHGGVTLVAHAARNVYLEAFTAQEPVPLNLRKDLLSGLRVEKNVSYVPYVHAGGRLTMAVTNDTPYPIHKLWFVCEATGKLYPDSVETFNTNYLFQGVMPPGQTRVAEVPFVSPSGGVETINCRLGGAESPYSWWEGIPPEAMRRQVGTFSEKVRTRQRVFLGRNLEPVSNPYAAVQ